MGNKNSGRHGVIETHPERRSIERAMVLDEMPISQIAKRAGVSYDTAARYRKRIPEERRREIVLAAQRDDKLAEDMELNGEQVEIKAGLKKVLNEIERILNKVRDEDDVLALTALRDMRATLLDLAKVYGQLQDKTTIVVSINEAPEWIRLRLILGDVFREHPEAGQAFLARVARERLSIAGQL